VEAFELSSSELELLVETCRLLDECESLSRAIGRDGMTVNGSAGQPRVHPGARRAAPAPGLTAHGIDASDWSQVHPVFRASRRAHARTVAELDALERSRRLSAGATLTDPA
jgi:hypothetical protein